MAFEATSRIQVSTHYGPRETGGTAGVETTSKSLQTLSIEFTGQSLKEGFISPLTVPKYAKMLRAFLTVDEVFTGVTDVSFGEGNKADVNGIKLVAADLVLGTVEVTDKLLGEWKTDAFLTRAVQLGSKVTGSPDITKGRASLVIEYTYKRRNDNEFAADPASLPDYPPQA